MDRDYSAFSIAAWPGDAAAAMRKFCDIGWEAFHDHGVSWIGFYVRETPDADELILAVRRDKPACSPIGLHGACGRALLAQQPLVVTDVANLGAGYIACDPRDKSELVIPLFETDGSCYAVLDADSYDTDAFHTGDVIGLNTLVEHAGLSQPRSRLPEIVRL